MLRVAIVCLAACHASVLPPLNDCQLVTDPAEGEATPSFVPAPRCSCDDTQSCGAIYGVRVEDVQTPRFSIDVYKESGGGQQTTNTWWLVRVPSLYPRCDEVCELDPEVFGSCPSAGVLTEIRSGTVAEGEDHFPIEDIDLFSESGGFDAAPADVPQRIAVVTTGKPDEFGGRHLWFSERSVTVTKHCGEAAHED
jgi:hypothetical protein